MTRMRHPKRSITRAIRTRRPLHPGLDLDSMDLLSFVVGIHTALGIDIPEADYSRFATLNGGIEYLAQRASVVRKG